MVDVLSKSTASLVEQPQVREALHTVLDNGGRVGAGQPATVPITIDGKQVEVARVPSTSSESKP